MPHQLALAAAATLATPLPISMAAPPAAEPIAAASLPVPDLLQARRDEADRLTVAVQIGGRGPFRFLIDTGAEKTVFADSLAASLALPLGAPQRVIGIAGSISVPTVAAAEIRFDHRAFAGTVVPLLPARDVTADGIIGLDGLQGLKVLFDFRRNLLALTDARPRGWDDGYEIVIYAQRRAGQLIMTHAMVNGVSAQVVIDTGAETSIGNRALQHALGRHRPLGRAVLQAVTGQAIDADLATGGQLAVGDLRINGLVIAFADAPAFAALRLDKHPALLLGMRELRSMKRMAIDFAKRRVLFDVDTARANT